MRIRVGLYVVLGLVPAMIQPSRACGQQPQGQQGQVQSRQNSGQVHEQAAEDRTQQIEDRLQGNSSGLDFQAQPGCDDRAGRPGLRQGRG